MREHVDRHRRLAAVRAAGDPGPADAGELLAAPPLRQRVELGARLLADLRLVGGRPVRVEADAPLDDVPAEHAPERPGAAHRDGPPGDLRRDRAQPPLVAAAVLPVGDPPRRRGGEHRERGELDPQRRLGAGASLHAAGIGARRARLDSGSPAGVAQLVEHSICNRECRGSSPLSGLGTASSHGGSFGPRVDRNVRGANVSVQRLRMRLGVQRNARAAPDPSPQGRCGWIAMRRRRSAAARSRIVTDANGAGSAADASVRR